MNGLSVGIRVVEIIKGKELLKNCSLKVIIYPSNEFKVLKGWKNVLLQETIKFVLPTTNHFFSSWETTSEHKILFHIIDRTSGDLLSHAQLHRVQQNINRLVQIPLQDQIQGELAVNISISSEPTPTSGFQSFSPSCLSAISRIRRALRKNGLQR